MRKAVFAAVPLLVLIVLAETAARIWALADPQLFTRPLPEEEGGLFVDDPDLFWRLAPDLNIDYRGNRVRTNAQGLRSPPLSERTPDEFRILSLGESTTFGTGVENAQTYSARLEAHLNAMQDQHRVRVLNAGTPAHSSYQFATYLREEGLELEPDLVLLYSEVNDYLPASLRDSSHNEVGVARSDAELAAARGSALRRWLETNSALYRALSFARARRAIARFETHEVENPMDDIGLPSIGLRPRVFEREEGSPELAPAGISEQRLPPRVKPDERVAHLQAIAEICRENDIALLVIHPAYRQTRPHECALTRLVREQGIDTLEAYPVLHPDPATPGALYRDQFHPTRRGHERLARALARKIARGPLATLEP